MHSRARLPVFLIAYVNYERFFFILIKIISKYLLQM